MKSRRPPKANLREFFDYINERDRIRRKRLAGEPKPWTSDPALQQYRFTNVKRDLDRTSQELQKIYLYHQQAPATEVIFNCALYRYFGTAEFANAVGWVRNYNPKKVAALATKMINARTAVFTGAYVITNGGVPAPKQNVVSERYLWPLWQARKRIAGVARLTNSWERTAKAMMQVPGFGGTGFMTKEALLDVMHFPLLAEAKDKATWTLAGPGARKGLNLLYNRPIKENVPFNKMLAEMRWLLETAPDYLDKEVPEFDVLHDIQWNLCEYSKLRTIREGGRGKRVFTPQGEDRRTGPPRSKPLSKEKCIEIYNEKCRTGASNKKLAEQFGLADDKMAHRAIHRAMDNNWVDPADYNRYLESIGRIENTKDKDAPPRTLVWFSCGAASAVAAKIAVEEYSNVVIAYCNTLATEHPDNERFLKDVEKWVGQKIHILSNNDFSSVEEVWKKEGYMAGNKGAPCTAQMKKVPRFRFQQPNDTHIFGLTAEEEKRVERFQYDNHDVKLSWPLLDKGITKEECFEILEDAGIELPVMYQLGYRNNNCIGCVKARSPAYWSKVRRDFPKIFKRRARLSRKLGTKLVKLKGKDIFLDELPKHKFKESKQEDISCGPDCSTK